VYKRQEPQGILLLKKESLPWHVRLHFQLPMRIHSWQQWQERMQGLVQVQVQVQVQVLVQVQLQAYISLQASGGASFLNTIY
jgi:hypothetical protein